jgi:hypothetical protein
MTQVRSKTNLMINLRHALLVLERCALATKDGVHFLERQALRLRDKEPDEGCAERSHEAEEDVGAPGDVFEELGRDLSDDEVVHPVGGAAEGGAVRAGGEGPDF